MEKITKEKPMNQEMKTIQEDALPEDLKLICSNENGKYVLFGSRQQSRIFGIFITEDSTMGSKLVLQELELPVSIPEGEEKY